MAVTRKSRASKGTRKATHQNGAVNAARLPAKKSVRARKSARPQSTDLWEELEDSCRQYVDLFDFAPVGYVILDSNGIIANINIPGANLLGRSRDDLIGRPLWLLVPPLERRKAMQHINRLRRGSERESAEIQMGDNGRISLLQLISAKTRRGQFRMVLLDVTEHRRMEQALRRRTAELTSVVETAAVGMHWVGPDGIIQWANEAETRMLGYKPQEYIGRHISELHADPEVSENILTRLKRGESVRQQAARLKCKNGSIKHVLIDSNALWDNGRFVHSQCFTMDITARKRAEEDLRTTRDHLAVQLTDMRRLHETSRRLAAAQDVERMLREVLDAALEVHGTGYGVVSLCNEDSTKLKCRVSRGFKRAFLKEIENVPAGGGACGTCYQQRRRVVVEDTGIDPLFAAYRDAAKLGGFRAVHSTPLLTREDKMIGVVTVHFAQPRQPTERETRLMDLYARMAADLIEGAQLREQMKSELASRKRAEEELRESESRYRTLLHSLPVAVYTTDAEGRIALFNDAAVELWGRTPEAGKERWCGSWRLYRADGTPQPLEECPMALALKQVEFKRGEEVIVERPDGSRRHVLPYPEAIHDASGKINGAVNVVVDITKRKSAETALRESEARYRQLLHALPAAVYTTDAQGRIRLFNEAAVQLWGRSPETGKDLWCGSWRIFNPDGSPLPLDECPMAVVLKSGKPVRGREIIVERTDGSRRNVLPYPEPILDAAGKVVGAVNMLMDITEAKAAETALRESEERLRLATQTGKLGIWDWDIRANRVSWTDSLHSIHGVTREEFDGTVDGFTKLVHPADRAFVASAIKRALDDDAPYELEFRAIRPDGGTVWIFTSAVVLRENGVPVRMLGASLDISERKATELALSESEQRFRAFTRNAPAAIFTKDIQGRYTSANPLACEAIGRPEGVIGLTDHEMLPKDVADALRNADLEVISSGRPIEREENVGDRNFLSVKFPLLDAEGQMAGVCGVAIDTTERKRAHEQLRQSEERFRALARAVPAIVWTTAPDGTLTYANDHCFAFTGMKPHQNGRSWPVLDLHPDDEPSCLAAWKHALETGEDFIMETRHRRSDGEYRWFLTRAIAARDTGGRITGWHGTSTEIHEVKLAGEALCASEERFRTLASHAPVGIFLSDLNGGCSYVNQHWCDMAGISPEQARGKGWTKALHPQDRKRVLAAWAESVAEGKASDAEFRFRRPDGVVRWVQGHAVPLRGPDGAPTSYIGTVSDITERKQAEEASRRLAAIVESSQDAILSKDLSGVIKSWNRAAEQLFGYSAEEIVGKPIMELVPPERHKEERTLLKRLRKGERIEHYETVRRRKDGSVFEVSLAISPLINAAGKPVGASTIARDITESKRAQEALRESEARFRQLADAMPQMVWAARPDGRTDYYNRRWYELTNAKEGEVGDESFLRVLHPDDHRRALETWNESVKTGRPFQIEYRFYILGANAYRWFLGRALPIRDELGKIVRWFGTCTDIDEQKQAEQRIIHLNETLVSVLEAIPDVVFVVNASGSIEFKNPAASRFIRDVGIQSDLPEPVRNEIARVFETGEHQLPKDLKSLHCFRINNSERYFLNRIVVMMDTGGQAFGAVAMLQDVTEFRLLDEVKTNLIATVSHELKTPITCVRNALHLLLHETFGPLNQKQMEFVSLAHGEGERLLRTLNSLLDLTRFEDVGIDAPMELKSPRELVETALQEVTTTAQTASVTLQVEIPDGLPMVNVDHERIMHVLTNLLNNAIRHSTEGSTVLVSARRDAEGVRFCVRDSGPGVPVQYQSRIFEKFFRVPNTPKKGTGLGLWIARQFVQAHGGRIGLTSMAGHGSEFYFILPEAG